MTRQWRVPVETVPDLDAQCVIAARVRGSLSRRDVTDLELGPLYSEVLAAVESSADAFAGKVRLGPVLRWLRARGWPDMSRAYVLSFLIAGPRRAEARWSLAMLETAAEERRRVREKAAEPRERAERAVRVLGAALAGVPDDRRAVVASGMAVELRALKP